MLRVRTVKECQLFSPSLARRASLISSYPYLVCTLDVNGHNDIPVLVGHVLEGHVSEDTSVVDENIDSAGGIDSGLNDAVTVLDGVVVGNSLAASGLDLVDNDICCLLWSQFGTRFYMRCDYRPLRCYPRPCVRHPSR